MTDNTNGRPQGAENDSYVPFCVEPGWVRSDCIAAPGSKGYRLLWWSESRVGFEHLCDRGERGRIICAPRLQAAHSITMDRGADGLDLPTITPSILCDDCGTHGFVTAGRWVSA